jgi:deoxyribodipyrimidine photo-lyase
VPKPFANKITLKSDKMTKNKFEIELSKIRKYYQQNDDLAVRGGREEALKIINHLADFKDYNKNRNTPSIPTTRLSAYLKFGCVSIREVYYKTLEKLGNKNELLVQYYWRDFYSMILFNFGKPTKGVITRPEFKLIDWDYDKEKFKRWCVGNTGCPIVDAGMRQMNQTGFMENRVRMIVATFLIFYLKIDWEYGMKYFSQKLVDADWANNVGNWQWTAGIEKWSNDYYRVFSMDSQMKRFDPDCKYIKTWIPELKNVSPKEIINWDLNHYPVSGYPEPIIKNNKEARKEGIEMYKVAIQKYKKGK